MCPRLASLFVLALGGMFAAAAPAATPPLLAKAFQVWGQGAGDLAFTQRTRVFLDDGSVKEERLERFDPSRPDSQRWHLLEVDGQPPTDEQRKKFEDKKNAKPRKAVKKSLTDYLDLERAVQVKDTADEARFRVPVKNEAAARLLSVENVVVVIVVEKTNGTIVHIAAMLREPVKVLLGLANITDFDLDIGIEPPRDDAREVKPGEVQSGSTARVVLSKFGNPMEYRWSDFKRVPSYSGPKKVSETAAPPATGPAR